MSLSPYVPTDHWIVDEILKMLNLKPEEVLYEIGCGDARVLIEAACKYGARGVGIEVNPIHAEIANHSVEASGLEDRIKIIEAGVLGDVDISPADAVYMYLTPQGLYGLKPKLERQLRLDCRLVSKDYSIKGWEYVEKGGPPGCYLFLYRMDSIHNL